MHEFSSSASSSRSRPLVCEFGGCGRTYSTLHARRQHYRRQHSADWQVRKVELRSSRSSLSRTSSTNLAPSCELASPSSAPTENQDQDHFGDTAQAPRQPPQTSFYAYHAPLHRQATAHNHYSHTTSSVTSTPATPQATVSTSTHFSPVSPVEDRQSYDEGSPRQTVMRIAEYLAKDTAGSSESTPPTVLCHPSPSRRHSQSQSDNVFTAWRASSVDNDDNESIYGMDGARTPCGFERQLGSVGDFSPQVVSLGSPSTSSHGRPTYAYSRNNSIDTICSGSLSHMDALLVASSVDPFYILSNADTHNIFTPRSVSTAPATPPCGTGPGRSFGASAAPMIDDLFSYLAASMPASEMFPLITAKDKDDIDVQRVLATIDTA